MADKRCDNGHFIDESWDLCPYCPAESSGEADAPALSSATFGSDEVIRRSTVSRQAPTVSRPAPTVESRRPVAMPTVVPHDNGGIEPPPIDRTSVFQKTSAGIAETRRYVVGWLVGLSGGSRGESFPVRIGRNVLGRDRRADIIINDDQASSHHADLVFRPEEQRFILMDHNSTNGTYVNEVEIEPRRDLAEKDVIRIGSHKYLFMPLCRAGFDWDGEGALHDR